MLLGNGILLQQGGLPAGVTTAGLLHSWALDDDALIVDSVGGINPTMYGGQALDYLGTTPDWSYSSGDQMAFLGGKTTASIGAVFNPDTAHNGHLIGGWSGGVPIACSWGVVSGAGYHVLRITGEASELCAYRVSGGAAGAWKRVWWQVDTAHATHTGSAARTPARVRCWVAGVEVEVVSVSGTLAQDDTFSIHGGAGFDRLSMGCGSTTPDAPAFGAEPFNGLIQRGWVTSELVTQAQAETLLTGHPFQFQALADGHIYVLDEGTGTTHTDYRSGSDTITSYHASTTNAWQNGDRQPAPCPQTILQRHGSGGIGAAGGASALVANGASYTSAGWSLPAAPFTISAWVRITDTPATTTRVVSMRQGSGSYYGLAFMVDTARSVYAYLVPQGASAVALTCAFSAHAGEWVNIVVRSSGANAIGHFAKASASTFTATSPASASGGAAVTAATQYPRFLSHSDTDRSQHGMLGRVLVYSRELSDAELVANHKAMRGAYV